MSHQDSPRSPARITAPRGLIAAFALSLCACSSQDEPGLTFQVNFACEDDGVRAERVMVGIAAGECPVTGMPLYQVTVERGGALVASAPGNLPAGDYAFFAVAYDVIGREVASACRVVSLPHADGVELELAGKVECVARDDSGGDDAGVLNGECGEPYDRMGYRDAQDFTCSDWKEYDCSRAREEWGYTVAQETDILANCSKSCRVCPPSVP